MIPNHYLDIILGLIVGGILGFGASCILSSCRRAKAYNMGWNAARKLQQDQNRL